MVYHYRGLIGSLIFPPTCLLCAAPGVRNLDLCAPCLAALPLNDNCCPQCALPLPGPALGSLCGTCVAQPPAFDLCTVPLLYQPPVDHLVSGLKFHQRLMVGRLLSGLLGEKLEKSGPEPPELIVPVPLHPNRLRQRGYNQALELARPLSRKLGIPLDWMSCTRTRETSPQSSLEKNSRTDNVRGAFHIRQPLSVRHVALVDDVVTTGATVSELARTLRRWGVEKVQVWAVARTP